MAWQNWSILERNFIEHSPNCSSSYYSQPLLGFLLINVHYIIPFSIMGIMGILQNVLVIQTLVHASFIEKWGTVYRFLFSINGILVSICLLINVFWNHEFSFIIGFICLILNSTSLWISAVLAFERMLMQLFFFKLYGIRGQHAMFITLLVFLFITFSYVLSFLFSQISFINFYFNLIGPGVVHIISLITTCICIIRRRYYLSDNTINFTCSIQTCSDYHGLVVAPLCIIICIMISIVSLQMCLLVLFNVIFFLPQIMTFMIYIFPSQDNMKKFKTQSICGQLLMKLNFC